MKYLIPIFLFPTALFAAEPAGPREHLSLDEHWSFTRGDPPSAEQSAFDDKAWRTLDVPHDWSIEGPLEQTNPTGGQGGFVPAGIGWYRRHFTTLASFKDKIVTVTFDGIYQNATVYLNGKQVGRQAWGYIGFTCDLTPHLAPEGQPNVLAVRVDNATQPNSRWYTGSGIYRHVWMDVMNRVHVDPLLVYVTTPKFSANSATIEVQETVRDDGPNPGSSVIIVTEVLDPDGKIVATNSESNNLTRQSTQRRALEVSQPRLWSLENPNLYTVRTRLALVGVDGVSQVMDQIETPFGIRSIEYDVNRGFLLNGTRVKHLGMCLHHDGGAVGAAVPIEVWERRLTALKAMGCNAIRTAHNPPAPEFLHLCDRLGFLVMDESFDEWSVAKGQLRGSYATMFRDGSEKDLTAMIRRDRNHPSIVMWSIGNEMPQQATQLGVDIARQLTAIVHREDPTRPVTAGCDNVHSPNPTRPEFLAALDIAGYNYVDRWNEHREIFFADDREKYPQRKFVGTEDVCIGGIRNNHFPSGAAAVLAMPQRGAPGRGPAPANPFPYASNMIRAEQLWKFNATHDYVIGYYMWTGIDYLGEAGAWPRKGAGSGTLDTCTFPKDGYYFYQSQWTTEPMVHILPHWNYPGERGTVIPVVVYSNAPQVELLVNGKSFGTKSLVFPRPGAVRSWNDPTPAGTTADLHLTWDVPYEPGTVRAIARRNGQIVAQKEIRTARAPATIQLTLDKTKIDAANKGIAHAEIRILDDQGTLVPTANLPITLTIEGPANLLAFDNGDQTSHEPYTAKTRNSFNGMALALLQAQKTPGKVKLTAKAEGLKEATIELEVTPGTPKPTLP